MRRRFRPSFMVAAALAAALGVPATVWATPPDSSGIVIRFDDVALVSYQDAADELVAVTGPRLEDGCFGTGFEQYTATIQAAELPTGVTTHRISVRDLPLWVYRGSSIEQLCDELASGGSIELIGSGTARFTHVDNDLGVSGTRMNAFGDAATGSIVDATGAHWSFAAVFRALVEGIDNGECLCRVVVEDITLRRRG